MVTEISIKKRKRKAKSTILGKIATLLFLVTVIACPFLVYHPKESPQQNVEHLLGYTPNQIIIIQPAKSAKHADVLQQQQQHIEQSLIEKARKNIEPVNNVVASVIARSKDNIQNVIKKSKHQREIVCVAKNVYYESRGEPYSGQVAVAMVTLNRAKIAKIPTCAVVYAKNESGCQFSWTCSKIEPMWDNKAWKESLVVAYITYNKLVSDVTSGATYYFNPQKANPKWAVAEIPVSNKYIVNGYLGDHRFFKAGIGDVYEK